MITLEVLKKIYYSDRQPVVQQVRDILDDYSSQWAKSDNEIKERMDAMLELQRMKLQLERDRLDFEREKAGLGKSQPKTNSTYCSVHVSYVIT